MKLKRELLVNHLARVICGGQISEAVFTGAFATEALTPDQLLLVSAPAIKGVSPLSEDIGLADLPKFVKALGVISGAGNEAQDVTLSVEGHRLVIDEAHRGTLRLMTAQPKTIATHLEEKTVKALWKKAPTGDGIPLTRALIEGLRSTFSLFKATEVEVFVGPEGGKIRVGNDNSDMAEFASEALVASEEYSLLFGEALVAVLATVTDFSSAVLKLGGPAKFICVEDSGYRYLLAPRLKDAAA